MFNNKTRNKCSNNHVNILRQDRPSELDQFIYDDGTRHTKYKNKKISVVTI